MLRSHACSARRRCYELGRLDQVASPAEDAAAFAFRRAAPHAVLDAMQERVLEALDPHGHSAHTRCAVSTPVPSDGKNSAGLIPRHRAWNIHAYSLRGLLHGHLQLYESVRPSGSAGSNLHRICTSAFESAPARCTTLERCGTLLCFLLRIVQRTLRQLRKAAHRRAVDRLSLVPRPLFSDAERIHGSRSARGRPRSHRPAAAVTALCVVSAARAVRASTAASESPGPRRP